MIPSRVEECRPRMIADGGNSRHLPDPATVDSDSGTEIEWQFATCAYCDESVSRFRLLTGQWFDRWGHVDDSAYVVPGSFA